MAGKRMAMPKRLSNKVFRRGTKVNGKNVRGAPMRGGIRL